MSYVVSITPDNIQEIGDKIKEIKKTTTENINKKSKAHIENQQRVAKHLIVILSEDDGKPLCYVEPKNQVTLNEYINKELMILEICPTPESGIGNNEYIVSLHSLNINNNNTELRPRLDHLIKEGVMIKDTNRSNIIPKAKETLTNLADKG